MGRKTVRAGRSTLGNMPSSNTATLYRGLMTNKRIWRPVLRVFDYRTGELADRGRAPLCRYDVPRFAISRSGEGHRYVVMTFLGLQLADRGKGIAMLL